VRGSQAARSLSDVLWDELQEQSLEPGRVAELSERLAQVASTLAMLAAPRGADEQARLHDARERARAQRGGERIAGPSLSFAPLPSATSAARSTRVLQGSSPRAGSGQSDDSEAGEQPPPSPCTQSSPTSSAGPASAGLAPGGGPDLPQRTRRDPVSAPVSAMLVDELAENGLLSSPAAETSASGSPGAASAPDVEPAGAREGLAQEQRHPRGPGPGGERARPDGPAPDPTRARSVRVGAAPIEDPGIEIKDERREAPARVAPDAAHPRVPWMASIMRRLERYEHDRLPFAVLLVELAGIERLRHAELPGEVARLTGLVEAALAESLRPADSLTRETPGRYWLLAPETDTPGAKALATRLAGRMRQASHRGAPLQLAVGIAVCPDDGLHASALAAQADIALFAAQASGRAVGRPDGDA
jgi:GGDEF domain-containing protein